MFRDRRRPERRDGDRDQRGRVVVFVAVGSRAQISHRLLLRLVLLGRRVSFSHDDDSMCNVKFWSSSLIIIVRKKKSFFTHSKIVFFLVEKLKAKLKAIFCVFFSSCVLCACFFLFFLA